LTSIVHDNQTVVGYTYMINLQLKDHINISYIILSVINMSKLEKN